MNEQGKSHWLTWNKSEVKQFLRFFTAFLLVLVFSAALLLITHNSARRDRALQEKLDTITAQLTEIAAYNDLLAKQITAKENELTQLAQKNTALATKLSAQSEQTLTIEEAEALQQQIKTMEKRLGVYGNYYMYLQDNFFIDLAEYITKDGLFVLTADGYMRTIGGKEITTEPEKAQLNEYRNALQYTMYSDEHFGVDANPAYILYFEDGYFLVLVEEKGYAAGGRALDELTEFYQHDEAFWEYVRNLFVGYPLPTYGVTLTTNGEVTIYTYYEGQDDVAVKLVAVNMSEDEITIVLETRYGGGKESSLWSRTNNNGSITGMQTREQVVLSGTQRHEIVVPRYDKPPYSYFSLAFGVSDTKFIFYLR